MDFGQNIFHNDFSFGLSHLYYNCFLKLFLVVVEIIIVLNEVSPSMPPFYIPHINKTKHVYTVFNFSILV